MWKEVKVYNPGEEFMFIPVELRDKIKEVYSNNAWKKGVSFTVGSRLINIIPELKDFENKSYYWATWKNTERSFATHMEVKNVN